MRRLLSSFVLLFSVQFAQAELEVLPATVEMLGEVGAAEIGEHPAFSTRTPVSIDAAELQPLRKALAGAPVKLVLLFGSWCHDSHREVPKVLALVSQLPNVSLTAIAVDRDKREPLSATEQYQLAYTPTLIVMRGGVELGRVTETPKRSWAADLLAIVQAH